MKSTWQHNITDYNSSDNVGAGKLLARRSKPRILIVEDDMAYEPIWQYVLKKVNSKCRIQWTSSAAEADRILSESHQKNNFFDLIISDIFVSGSKTGLDLWYKYGEPNNNMIIVSSIEYGKLFNYLGSGKRMPVYLMKPFDINECIKTVDEMLKPNK